MGKIHFGSNMMNHHRVLLLLCSWLLLLIATTQAFVVVPRTTTRVNPLAASSTTDAAPTLETCTAILTRAAETKAEDSEMVLQALLDLEKIARDTAKGSPEYNKNVLYHLHGSWRLMFTTGTKKTQDRFGTINYFPIKAIQSFDTENMAIENGIYVGDFALVKFLGEFEFDMRKRRLEFDFTKVTLLQFLDVSLGKGEAAQLGSKSGLGSDSNVANAAKDKKAFFNWISANADIATARGGGGGLALWKRVV